MLEVNATNKSGLTALDLFILCPCESGNGSEIMRLLLGRLGAARSQDSHTRADPVNPNSDAAHGDQQVAPTSSSPAREVTLNREEIISWENYFQFQLDRDNPSSARDALLVVAVLMATATYQASLTPPALSSNSFSFLWFMVANSLGFFASLNMIDILTYNFPLKLELSLTGLAMGATYGSAMITQAPEGPIKGTVIWLFVIIPIALVIFRCIKTRIKQHRLNSSAYRRHQSA